MQKGSLNITTLLGAVDILQALLFESWWNLWLS